MQVCHMCGLGHGWFGRRDCCTVLKVLHLLILPDVLLTAVRETRHDASNTCNKMDGSRLLDGGCERSTLNINLLPHRPDLLQ